MFDCLAVSYWFLHVSYCHHREGTNFEVRVEIETQPRGVRQSSLSSILSSRSLSVESLGHTQSQSRGYLCASELEERREGGGGESEEQEGREKPGGEAGDEGTVFPVFEIDGVWGRPMQALYLVNDKSGGKKSISWRAIGLT